jgi:hypothetical protein
MSSSDAGGEIRRKGEGGRKEGEDRRSKREGGKEDERHSRSLLIGRAQQTDE